MPYGGKGNLLQLYTDILLRRMSTGVDFPFSSGNRMLEGAFPLSSTTVRAYFVRSSLLSNNVLFDKVGPSPNIQDIFLYKCEFDEASRPRFWYEPISSTRRRGTVQHVPLRGVLRRIGSFAKTLLCHKPHYKDLGCWLLKVAGLVISESIAIKFFVEI